MKEKKQNKGLIDLFYGGFIASVTGIALLPLYKTAVILVIAGVFGILASGILMIKKNLKENK